jgi:hypothetical protein
LKLFEDVFRAVVGGVGLRRIFIGINYNVMGEGGIGASINVSKVTEMLEWIFWIVGSWTSESLWVWPRVAVFGTESAVVIIIDLWTHNMFTLGIESSTLDYIKVSGAQDRWVEAAGHLISSGNTSSGTWTTEGSGVGWWN